jgi:hypothetical protein
LTFSPARLEIVEMTSAGTYSDTLGQSQTKNVLQAETRTAVLWKNSMAYEQLEVLSKLQAALSMKIFAPDDVMIVVKDHIVCCPGNEPDRTDTISITGRASPLREQLYLRIVRRIRFSMISDCGLHVRFGVGVGDVLPAFNVEPLVTTAHSRACRYWQRAMWAMRCGIIRKIADARALTQARVNSNSTVRDSTLIKKHSVAARPAAATGAGQRGSVVELQRQSSAVVIEEPSSPTTDPTVLSRRYRPISHYHAVCASPTIELHRLCSNTPTLFVMWASWDPDSMMWLRRNLFNPQTIPPEPGSPVSVPEAQRLSTPPPGTAQPDPWLQLVSKYVAPLPKAAPPADSTQGHKKKGKNSVRTAVVGLRTSKRAAIVLICLDEDRATGVKAFDELRRQFRFWTSQEVAMSALWGGEEGFRSPLASNFDISSLPLVCAVLPPNYDMSRDEIKQLPSRRLAQSKDKFHQELSYRAGFNPTADSTEVKPISLKRGWPLVAVCEEPLRLVAPDLSEVAQRCMDRTYIRVSGIMQMWEDIPAEKRREIINEFMQRQKRPDSPMVFESCILSRYALDQGPYLHESDLTLRATVSSTVSLVGSAFAGHLKQFGEALEFLKTRVKNFEFCVVTLQESDPLEIRLLPVTAEARVKGQYHCVQCLHCRKIVDTDAQAHFQCLHCHSSESAVCEGCFLAARHFKWHIAVKIRPSGLEKIPVLWGRSNVTMLPTVNGNEVFESESRTHSGVYCNICKELIVGARWKCCNCHEFDMCSTCERTWWNNVITCTHDHRHAVTHVMLFVPLAVPGDGNQLLCPRTM